MKITTTQVTADDALRAVADGKSVQMIWMDDGRPFFSDLTEKIKNAVGIGETFLIVEVEDDGDHETVTEEPPETVVTDPDTTPITVKIPNSHKAERASAQAR